MSENNDWGKSESVETLNLSLTIDDLKFLIGEKEIELLSRNKLINSLQRSISELTIEIDKMKNNTSGVNLLNRISELEKTIKNDISKMELLKNTIITKDRDISELKVKIEQLDSKKKVKKNSKKSK